MAPQNGTQACQNGACTASATCVPGAVRRHGANVEICNPSGTAWLYNFQCNRHKERVDHVGYSLT